MRTPALAVTAAFMMTLLTPVTLASDGLRVSTWNITNYSSGRAAAFETSVYGEFQGRQFAPDVLVVQEILSQSAVTSLLAILNNAPGSPGDWAAAPFINGRDTDNALYYRTSRVDFLGQTVIATGAPSPFQPRDTNRYDLRPTGYSSEATTMAIYSTHMKAGSSSSDQVRRTDEANNIRNDIESLPSEWNAIVAGDFNIQTSSQTAYNVMVSPFPDTSGQVIDPISTPGSWNNNSSFKYIHTQDPRGGGGMDDRYDQILIAPSLLTGDALSYIGEFGTPYSTTTWDDPNHSYRSWGNDGTSYNVALRTTGNTMVGAAIAQALIDTTGNMSGHLPVFLDLRVPALIDSTESIDVGRLVLGSARSAEIGVSHTGDVALWGPGGIDDLDYSLMPSLGVQAPAGGFELIAGSSAVHPITITPAVAGPIDSEVLISSDASNDPSRLVSIVGEAVPGCSGADLEAPFGELNFNDVIYFLAEFAAGSPTADLADTIGVLDFSDVLEFLTVFAAGCP